MAWEKVRGTFFTKVINNNFRSFLGYEWIGWRNDTLQGRPVEITFEFKNIRNFSSVIIHTNNMFSKDVQVRYYTF